MKNLNKRNKIVVGIVGIVIVVIAAGIALLQTDGTSLFGATVELKIYPEIARVAVGQRVQLSVANADSSCRWSTNSAVVSLSPVIGASTYAAGMSAGTAIVTANCTTGTGSRTVTVTPMPPTISPQNPVLGVGQTVALNVGNGDTTCGWSASSAAVSLLATSGVTNTVRGMAAGQATVTVACSTGTASTSVSVVTPPAITPANPRIKAGQTPVTLSESSGYSCTWSASPSGGVSLSTTNGSSTVVTGLAAGQTTVTATCQYGRASAVVTVPTLTLTATQHDQYGGQQVTNFPYLVWRPGTNALVYDNRIYVDLSVGDTGMNCSWSKGADYDLVRLSTTSTTARVTGESGLLPGGVDEMPDVPITVTCGNQSASKTINLEYWAGGSRP